MLSLSPVTVYRIVRPVSLHCVPLFYTKITLSLCVPVHAARGKKKRARGFPTCTLCDSFFLCLLRYRSHILDTRRHTSSTVRPVQPRCRARMVLVSEATVYRYFRAKAGPVYPVPPSGYTSMCSSQSSIGRYASWYLPVNACLRNARRERNASPSCFTVTSANAAPPPTGRHGR